MSLGSASKGRALPFNRNMSTLRDFSQALYDFHCEKVGLYNSIESLCSVAKDYYIAQLGNVEESEFAATHLHGLTPSEKKSKLLTWITKEIQEINDIVKRESDNDLHAAEELYKRLFDVGTAKPKYANMTCNLDAHTDLYRVRSAERYNIYDRKGMFLLSDKLENLVGAYRFNPSGYACLYLASNLYLAWEETRRPDFDKLNFSRFQNTRKVEVLDITINKDCKYQGQFLMAYLSLLCGAKTTDKDKHNYQYVVPQMMMKILCLSQRQFKNINGSDSGSVAGIKYMSSRRYDQKDLLFDDWKLTIAYVFPQHPHDDSIDVCPYLANLFKLTEPRTYFFFKAHRYDFHTKTARVSGYQDSLFYQLEEEMKNLSLGKYDTV